MSLTLFNDNCYSSIGDEVGEIYCMLLLEIYKTNSYTLSSFFLSLSLSLAVCLQSHWQTDTTYCCNPTPSASSPSPANQMHSENKLSNHGKQVTSGSQSQLPNVNQAQQQGPAGNQGSKGSGSGSHGVKSNQISPGNPGLKSLNQSGGGIGGMMKTKAKRERSVSMDTGDQRESLTPVLEPDAKGRRNATHILRPNVHGPPTVRWLTVWCILHTKWHEVSQKHQTNLTD